MKELTNQKTAKLFIRGFLEAKKNEDKEDNGFDFKSKLFSEGISDNNKNIEEDIENIIGFLSKKFLSKIIEK